MIKGYGDTINIKSDNYILIDKYIFDMGASLSCMWGDNLPYKYTKSYLKNVHDVTDTKRNYSAYRLDSISIDKIKLQNALFVFIPDSILPKRLTSFDGIIGMNIINKANWLFDIKNQKLFVLNKDSTVDTPTNCLNFSYILRGNIPFITLKINSQWIKNILIDTGSRSYLDLFQDNINSLNKQNKAILTDTVESAGIHNIKYSSLRYTYEELDINDTYIDSIKIKQINKFANQKIGIDFIKRFDYFFINTKKRLIYLYN